MFGYLMYHDQNPSEYQSYYCGLCHTMKARYGNIARFTLNHDLTFLAILLTSLYEEKDVQQQVRCILHPLHPKTIRKSKYLDYAADMTILLSLFKLEDNVIDDGRKRDYIAYQYMKKCYQKYAIHHQEKYVKIEKALADLHELEQQNTNDIDALCALSGAFLGEVFAYQNDEWHNYLYMIGERLGRFIYLLDAYDDLEQDKIKGRFNPLIHYETRSDFEEWMKENLTMLIAEAATHIQRLPLFEHLDLIENVIYSGVWSAYQRVYEKRNGGKNERSL